VKTGNRYCKAGCTSIKQREKEEEKEREEVEEIGKYTDRIIMASHFPQHYPN
jgi:hypothetical protein